MLRPRALPSATAPGRLTEAPVWDGARAELLWVDIPQERVYQASLITPDAQALVGHTPDEAPVLPEVSVRHTSQVGQQVGAVVPCASGALLAAAGTSFFRLESGRPPFHLASLTRPDDGVARRMNDAKCDPHGRLLAGTKAYDDTPGAGALYRFDPDGSLTTLIASVTISNGLGWSPDGTLFYYADSPTGRVDVFDYDLESGRISARRPFVALDGGTPDGLTVDSEGRVWVAVWGAGEVRAYESDGTPYAVVRVPASHVSSCAFAGPELDILVITTATEGLSDDQLAAEPDAGRLFLCRPGVTGLPATPYADSGHSDHTDVTAH